MTLFDNASVIVTGMAGQQTSTGASGGPHAKTTDEVFAELTKGNPELKAELDRTALANAVALFILRYRTERNLSQRDLAELLDMKQPQVARLESSDVNPSLATLARLAGALGAEFAISVSPQRKERKLIGKRAEDATLESYEASGARVSVAIS